MRMRGWWSSAGTLALVGAVVIGGVGAARARVGPPLCGTRSIPPRTYAHVVWIWMENRSYDDVVGSAEAPYINDTLIADCGLAVNAHNVTHPSLPNYIAATSGLAPAQLHRLRHDCRPEEDRCTTPSDSIFAQVETWKSYQEAMPSPCFADDSGRYSVIFNPPLYYSGLTGCDRFDVPFTELQQDLDADTLPAFSFVAPDLCHDMHSCSVETGDAWLAREVPRIAASAAYRRGTTAIFLSFDEGEKQGSRRCATNTRDVGCHIATIVIAPSTPAGTTSAALFNHFSLLRTTEEMLGIPTFLGEAARASSMRAAFNL
jgi:hypothetical protein